MDFDEHLSTKLPHLDAADASLPQAIGKMIHKRCGDIRQCGPDKAGSTPFSAVSVERELGYQKGFSIDIEDREVGFSRGIGKDAQVGDLGCQAIGFSLPIIMTCTQENHQTRADGADGLASYGDLPFLNSLDDGSHDPVRSPK